MKKYIIPAFLLLAVLTVSCEDNLDIPQKGVISTSDFYASDADAQAALADMYSTYISQVASPDGIRVPEQVILNYSADDILAGGKSFEDHADFRVFDEFKFDDANTTLKSAYQRYYYSIYHANLIISNFTNENRTGSEPKWKSEYTEQCVAEARVMRAYLHMMTALIWNQPPLMDRVYEGDEMPPVNTDKTQEEILQWVIDECQKAIASGSLLKRNGTSDKDATARMTVGFAQFVAGKAAMFKNDPATARKYLGDLIASGDYDLIPGDIYWTNFHKAGDGNSEKIFEPNFIDDPSCYSGTYSAYRRDRWQVANVFAWRTKTLSGLPTQLCSTGWGGGAIQETFAKKFLEHDGNSPRRLACFITGDEFLYEIEWTTSKVNDGTLEEKKADPNRGIKVSGMPMHSTFFEWKHQSYQVAPKILTGGAEYEPDFVQSGLGVASNEKNYNVARYAEALLLYAEACIGSPDEAKGLAALQKVQQRSGSGKISSALTFDNVMEEKQYEMWFESCRFLDLVRWSKQGKVDLNAIYNTSRIHKDVPTVLDEFAEPDKPGYKTEHKLFVKYSSVPGESDFIVNKNEYLPFPRDVMTSNKNLHNVLGWAYLDK